MSVPWAWAMGAGWSMCPQLSPGLKLWVWKGHVSMQMAEVDVLDLFQMVQNKCKTIPRNSKNTTTPRPSPSHTHQNTGPADTNALFSHRGAHPHFVPLGPRPTDHPPTPARRWPSPDGHVCVKGGGGGATPPHLNSTFRPPETP